MSPTSLPKWPNKAGMNAFYGNPDANGDGKEDASYAAAHIISITPPYPMLFGWDVDGDGKVNDRVKSIRVNKACAETLEQCLVDIRDLYGSQAEIEKHRMHLYGGCYVFRVKRGSSGLSVHSWGGAIDLDPERNGFRQPYKAGWSIPMEVVAIFERAGAIWGGRWSAKSSDPMHFQFTSGNV